MLSNSTKPPRTAAPTPITGAAQEVPVSMDSSQLPLLRKALADAIGTFALVFAGCGAVVVDAQTGALGHVGISGVFGLVVAVMIFATGHISGAHFNPAVTIAFAVAGRFPWKEVPAYLIAQSLAAIAASAAILGLIGPEAALGSTVPSVALGPAMGMEVLLTFFLMFVITSVATDSRASGHLAAVAIGGTVALCALMGGPLTGASMNPARSLGPALVSGTFDAQWLYVVGPIGGAILGAVTYGFVACGPVTKDAAGCC